MREDVLIVLNEREPLKQQMALELSKQLTERSVCNERLKPSAKLSQILRERSPAVVVLDYLVGDFGTALDILGELQRVDAPSPVQVIIWTDEPSVSVAISSMKAGARDYIEISAANSLEKVLEAIERALRTSAVEEPYHEKKRAVHDEDVPVGQDKNFVAALTLAAAAALRNQRIIVVLGELGVGRNTVGHYIHSQRNAPGQCIEIDYNLFADDVALITGGAHQKLVTPLLSYGATVIVDHVESDPGELLDAVERQSARIWDDDSTDRPLLVVGTTSAAVAQSWVRLAAAEIIEIPPLHARTEDFLPLVQRFSFEAQAFARTPKIRFSSALLEHISELRWPGNVRQLKAATIEAVSALYLIDEGRIKSHETSGDGGSESPAVSKMTKADAQLLRALLASKLRWERYNVPSALSPHPMVARRTLDEALGNMRIAAARLGVGIPVLRAALGQPGAENQQARQLSGER